MGGHWPPLRKMSSTAVSLASLSSLIATVPSQGKGEIHKRVENRRLSTLLCAPPRRRVPFASQAQTRRISRDSEKFLQEQNPI